VEEEEEEEQRREETSEIPEEEKKEKRRERDQRLAERQTNEKRRKRRDGRRDTRKNRRKKRGDKRRKRRSEGERQMTQLRIRVYFFFRVGTIFGKKHVLVCSCHNRKSERSDKKGPIPNSQDLKFLFPGLIFFFILVISW